jgi:hypothetical protein
MHFEEEKDPNERPTMSDYWLISEWLSMLTGNAMEAHGSPSGSEKKKAGPVARTELLVS